jgi:hypothetical protein
MIRFIQRCKNTNTTFYYKNTLECTLLSLIKDNTIFEKVVWIIYLIDIKTINKVNV